MKRTIGLLMCLAVLGIVGLPMTSGAGVPDADQPKKVADKKDGDKKVYPDQVWASDTAVPEPKKVVAPAPKPKPYTGPVWSTDTMPADGK